MGTAPRRQNLSEAPVANDLRAADPGPFYRIIVRDLVLPWRIGVRQHEEDRRQRVRLNLDLVVREQPDPGADDYKLVLCYDKIVENIRGMAASGHIKLAETVAHKVAMMCLTNPSAEEVTVRVEKLEAIHDAASVGVEITRSRRDTVTAGSEKNANFSRKR